MKFFSLVGLWLVALTTIADSQGFRGGAGAGSGRSGGAWSSPSISLAPSFQPRHSLPVAPPQRPAVIAPNHRGPASVAPLPLQQTQTPARFRVSPHVHKRVHHWHRPRHFHRHHHPGVVFYGVPYVVGGSTVITQVAPGVVRAERRYLQDSTTEAPEGGRTAVVAPFDPTPQEVVGRMLVLAGVAKNDVIYDLGSGDGRILIAAAKKYGARGVGFELDPGLIKLARENARREGVEKLVEFRQQDLFTADLSPASVVTLYLSYDGNRAVREQLKRQLKPGARVVSYTFDMGDWPPKIAETYRDAAGESHSLYLWEIIAPALASTDSEMLQPHPTRSGPLIIEVR
jgi:SAM-dependent methyltransferase